MSDYIIPAPQACGCRAPHFLCAIGQQLQEIEFQCQALAEEAQRTQDDSERIAATAAALRRAKQVYNRHIGIDVAQTQDQIDALTIEHLRDLRGEWPLRVLDLLRRAYEAASWPMPDVLAPDWQPPKPVYYSTPMMTTRSVPHTWPDTSYTGPAWPASAAEEDTVRDED